MVVVAQSLENEALLIEHHLNVFLCQGFDDTFLSGDEIFRKSQFGFLQLENFFLYRITGNKFVGEDFFLLANAMGPVNGLLLHCRKPN